MNTRKAGLTVAARQRSAETDPASSPKPPAPGLQDTAPGDPARIPAPVAEGRGRGRVLRGVARVAGELLITIGIVLGLFVAWDLWGTNLSANATQAQAVRDFTRGLDAPLSPKAALKGDYGPAPATAAPTGIGEVFGVAYIPRLGATYSRPLVQGTSQAQLDTLGLGHYPATQMPGQPGNFAVAGHRQTHGAVLDNIDTLVPGDRIYIQTRQGYYTYVFRNSEIVTPDHTAVVLPVPDHPGAQPTESLLTMTSCNPKFGDWQRFIAYSVLESWQPLDAGPPAEIAAIVAANEGKG